MDVDKIDELLRDLNKGKTNEVFHRTVLMIGVSRSGKSTLTTQLINGVTKLNDLKLYSETKESVVRNGVMNHDGKVYSLKIIDTPGLAERKKVSKMPSLQVLKKSKQGGYRLSYDNNAANNNNNAATATGSQGAGSDPTRMSARPDNVLLQDIMTFVYKHTTELHLVLFIYDINKGIDPVALKTLRQYEQYFQKILTKCAIVFTKAEKLTDQEKQHAIKEFAQMESFEDYGAKEIFENGVYFTGAIDPFLVRLYPHAEAFVKAIINNVNEDLNAIVKLIAESDKPLSMTEMKKEEGKWCQIA